MTDEPENITLEILKKIQATQAEHGAVLASHGEILNALTTGQQALTEAVLALSSTQAEIGRTVAAIAGVQGEHSVRLLDHRVALDSILGILGSMAPRLTRLERDRVGA